MQTIVSSVHGKEMEMFSVPTRSREIAARPDAASATASPSRVGGAPVLQGSINECCDRRGEAQKFCNTNVLNGKEYVEPHKSRCDIRRTRVPRTIRMGSATVKKFGDLHEEGSTASLEVSMDQRNNRIGRAVGGDANRIHANHSTTTRDS